MKGTYNSNEEDLINVNLLKYGTDKEKRKAFNALYKKYFSSLLYIYMMSGNNRSKTEEFVKDSFKKMYLNINSYDETLAKFSTWLFNITKNTFISEQRKIETQQKHFLKPENLENQSKEVEQSVEDKIIEEETNKEIKLKIKKAINSIKEEELKTIINSIFYKNKTVEEIAQEISQPPEEIKNKINKALTEIKYTLLKLMK